MQRIQIEKHFPAFETCTGFQVQRLEDKKQRSNGKKQFHASTLYKYKDLSGNNGWKYKHKGYKNACDKNKEMFSSTYSRVTKNQTWTLAFLGLLFKKKT